MHRLRPTNLRTLLMWLPRLALFGLLASGPVASSRLVDTMFAAPAGMCAAQPVAGQCSTGRIIILPGIRNTRFHLAGIVRDLQAVFPNFEIEVRTWGVPLAGLHNLHAYERNIQTAQSIADDISEWRRGHPADTLYIVGYSGGGGIATLVAAALEDGTAVDRLILVAPAVAPDFPLREQVLPHVREFIVNFASESDLQVGLGTRVFGTINGVETVAAGFSGFHETHPRLVEWHWTAHDERLGHRGNHLGYLGRRWQRSTLLPVLDPRVDAVELQQQWESRRDQPHR
jgi:hypothetical protein